MDRKEFLKKVCKEVESNIDDKSIIYVTKDTEVYVGLKGFTEKSGHDSFIDYLIEHEINFIDATPKFKERREKYPVANIGFSEKENKWYGWSHRGVCGFTIGSEVKKDNVAYNPSTAEDYEEYYIRFWSYGANDYIENIFIDERTEDGFYLITKYNDKVPNKKLRGTSYKMFVEYPKSYGKGEWKAETIEDAKEMAINYADNIS